MFFLFLLLVLAGGEQDNWAVLVSTSRDWENYRHSGNALGIYQELLRLGLPARRIILFVGSDVSVDVRNRHRGKVFVGRRSEVDVNSGASIAYHGDDAMPEMFYRVMADCIEEVSERRRLRSSSSSRLLLYMTGHGVTNYLNFRKRKEISAGELGSLFDSMFCAGRYKEMLFVVDTCEAATLFSEIRAPGISGLASSRRKESSYSQHINRSVGVSVVDQMTFRLQRYLAGLSRTASSTLGDFMLHLKTKRMRSAPVLFSSGGAATGQRLGDFFGGHSERRVF